MQGMCTAVACAPFIRFTPKETTMPQQYTVAVLAGDGIGKEVMPEGLRALKAAAERFHIDIAFTEFEWASCDYYVVRENTEGEYTSLGGIMYEGTDREIVIQESVYSRKGTDRLLKFAFELAQSRPKKHVTLATKSNGIAISMPWWDKRADAVAADYPDVKLDKQHIDILTARFVLQPGRFDVVAATNLFGDILSDLGPATTGTIGLAPSANLNPERTYPSLFEPVHGSAPDIYGQNIANPIAMVWSGALLLDFLTDGQGAGRQAHDAIMAAIEQTLKTGPLTPDLGGTANTTELGQAIAGLIAAG